MDNGTKDVYVRHTENWGLQCVIFCIYIYIYIYTHTCQRALGFQVLDFRAVVSSLGIRVQRWHRANKTRRLEVELG